MTTLENYERDVLAILGSIQAHKACTSSSSCNVIRDLSLQIEKQGTQLRKDLKTLRESLVVHKESNDTTVADNG